MAAFPSALGTHIPEAAAAFNNAYPDMDLQVVEAEPPDALKMLRTRDVEIAIILHHEDDVAPDDISTAQLMDEPVLLVTNANSCRTVALLRELVDAFAKVRSD